MRALILGGGVSGLTSALALRRAAGRSVDILLVEPSAKRLGGWLHSFRQNGLLFEHGGRGIRPVGPSGMAAVELVESIPGLPEKTLVASPAAQTRYLLFGGQVRPVPTKPFDALTSPLTAPMVFPLMRLAAAAGLSAAGLRTLSALVAPGASAAPAYDDVSVHAYALRLFGDTDGGATAIASLIHRLKGQSFHSPALGSAGAHAAEVLLDAVMSGIYAGDVRALSARAVLASLWNLERGGAGDEAGGLPNSLGAKMRAALRTALPGSKKDPSSVDGGRRADSTSPFVAACMSSSSVSFTGGMQTMVDAMAEQLIRESAKGSAVVSGDREGLAAIGAMAERGTGTGLTHIVTGVAAEELYRSDWLHSGAGPASSLKGPAYSVKLSSRSDASKSLPMVGADYVISTLPANVLARVLRNSNEARGVADRRLHCSEVSHRSLTQAADKLDAIPFASIALVNLGYKGKNYLPGPAVVEERKKRAASPQKPEGDDKNAKAPKTAAESPPEFAGFGYLAPYCERKPAPHGSPLAGAPFSGLSSPLYASESRESVQRRYSGSPAAGVLGMTWDSTVFPGQAASHAEAVESGKMKPRRDILSGSVLPGRDVDVSYEAAEGETRVTVMMGGAMHADLVDSIDEGFAVYKAISAAANHVGLPAKADEVSVAVARSAIPQYNVGHAARVQEALAHVAAAYRATEGAGSLGLDIIGNSFHGVGIADSMREAREAGLRAAKAIAAHVQG